MDKEKRKAYKKLWAAANPDKVKAARRKWRETNRAVDRAVTEQWRAENKERMSAKHKEWLFVNSEHVAEYTRIYKDRPEVKERRRVRSIKWHAENRAYSAEKQSQRRIRAKFPLSPTHQAEIEGMYQFCKIFPGFEVDHIVPINGKIVSGLHVPWNMQVLVKTENRRKSNKFNEENLSG